MLVVKNFRPWPTLVAAGALLALAACSKDVSVQKHLGDDRMPEMRQIDGLADAEEKYGPLSFSPADDAKVIALAKRESEFTGKAKATHAKIEASRAEGTREVHGEVVLSPAARADVPYKELYEEVVLELGDVILNPNYIANTLYTENVRMQRLLAAFNSAVAAVMQADPEFLLEKNFFHKYWEAVAYGCKKDEPVAMKECTSIEFFATDANTAQILQFFAWVVSEELTQLQVAKQALEAKNLPMLPGIAGPGTRKELLESIEKANKAIGAKVRKYQQLVMVVLKSQNRYIPSKVGEAGTAVADSGGDMGDILLLNGAIQYMNYLYALPKRWTAERFMAHHVQDVQRAIARAPDKLANPKYVAAIRQVLEKTNFWNDFSRRKISDFSKWGPNMFRLAVDPRLCKGSGRDETIRRSLAEIDALGAAGFLKLVEEAKSGAPAEIAKNLDVQFRFVSDEFLYLADQLFRGHWNVEDASSYWSSCLVGANAGDGVAKMEKKRQMITTLEKYMKFQMLRMIVRTNKRFGEIFSDKNARTQTMFKDAVENSEQIGNEWRGMLSQLRDFETFIKKYAKETNAENELPEYKRIELVFANMKKNISMMAVYPPMLAMSFLMAKEGISMPLMTFWGPIDLDAETVINWLFAQITKSPPQPWFNFGNDNKAIAKYENLYAFFFALKTMIFETMNEAMAKGGKPIDLNPREFFKVITQKFTNQDRLDMREYVYSLEGTYGSNSRYNDTLQMCTAEQKYAEELARGGNPRQPVYPRMQLTLDRVTSFTFVGREGWSDNFTAFPVQAFYKEKHLTQLKIVRLFLAKSVVFLDTMIELFEKHKEEQIAQAAKEISDMPVTEREAAVAQLEKMRKDLDADLDEIQAAFAELRDLKRRIYATILRVYNETRSCLDTIYAVERRQQYALYDFNIEHLRKVHARLAKLKELEKERPGEEAGVEAQRAWQARVTEMEAQLTAETQADSYLYKPGDVRLYDKVTLAAGYTLAQWDLTLRNANWLERINPNIVVERPDINVLNQFNLFRNGMTAEGKLDIPYVENQEAFVNQVLRTLHNRFISWSSTEAKSGGIWSLDPFKNRLALMLELYMAQEMKIYKDDFTTCKRDEQGKKICVTQMPDKEVTVDSIISEVQLIAKLAHIDTKKVVGRFGDTESSYMERVGVGRKYDPKELKDIFLEERSMLPLPMYDLTFKKLLASVPYLDEATVAIQTLEAMRNADGANGEAATNDGAVDVNKVDTGELIFLSDKDQVRKSTIERFKPFVDGTFSYMQKLINALDAKAGSDRGAGSSYVFEIDLNNKHRPVIEMKPELDRDNKPVYLDSTRVQDFESLQRKFHTETKRRFLKAGVGETR